MKNSKTISDTDILSDGLLRLGLDAGMEEILNLLNRYIDEIELFNPAYGLVGAADRRELVIKHILDSLAPLAILRRLLENCGAAAVPAAAGGPVAERPQGPRIAVVGSGAGLPGIPLAIAMPDCRFTLIERMGRRAGFLRNTLAVLGLTNVVVEEKEMEKAAQDRFDLITFRAFRPLTPDILKGLVRLLAPGGVLAAYKGRRDRVEEEMAALADRAGAWTVEPCPVPFLNEERYLVTIRRT
jgi:16S rRNA (guanine527-N7)-methyltransferase